MNMKIKLTFVAIIFLMIFAGLIPSKNLSTVTIFLMLTYRWWKNEPEKDF